MKKNYIILVMCFLFFYLNSQAQQIYTIRLIAHKNLAFPIVKNFGIKGDGSKGGIEVRMFYEPFYFSGGRNGRGIMYGTKITANHPNDYGGADWLIKASEENAPWYCNMFGIWFCGDNDYSVTSSEYQLSMHTYFNYLINGHYNIPDDVLIDVFTNSYGRTMEVLIEVEFSGASTLEDLIEINLPGIKPINRDYLHSLKVKGINFQIRPTAKKADLDSENITYDKVAVSTFPISENLMGGHFKFAYEIVIPRNLPANAPRSTEYGTNIAVYPIPNNNTNSSYPYFFYVSATHERMANTLSGILSTEIKPLFKAVVNGTEYTYKLFKVPTHSSDRILIKGITKLGPFPTEEHGNIQIMAPEVTEINPKMHDKINLPNNQKYLVAWHRGDWRGAPENTLESIEAAQEYDLLELDISRAGGGINASHIPNYVLYHDPFMFRESSIGPTDACVNPYDRLLVNSTMLALAQRQNLRNELKSRFPGYSETDYDNWIKGPGDFTFSELRGMYVRDRFGCLTEINIPDFEDAVDVSKQFKLAIMIDKGWDDIDGIYWTAIEHNYENNIYFKGGPNRPVSKLKAQYGDQLMKQIGYTPFYFDNMAQLASSTNSQGKIKFLEDFIIQEHVSGWNIPGFELQIKMMESDGSTEGFNPVGIQRLLKFNAQYKESKWMGITQINPTAYNGFDNKYIFMNANSNPKNANTYSSRFDRRADPIFNLNYLKCDYWTTDRPDVIINFLKTLGKTN